MEPQLDRLIAALNAVYDPIVSTEIRREAHQFLETFRESQTNSSSTGFLLISRTDLPVVHRYFGAQLIENTVKYCWDKIEAAERQQIKCSCLLLIKSGLQSVDASFLRPMKDVVCRCIVAMAIREWPQVWTDLLPMCRDIVLAPETVYPDMIFMIWSRLVEDVIQLQIVEPVTRRRELHAAINSQVDQLIELVKLTLNEHIPRLDSARSLALCLSALDLTANTFDWMPSVLFADGTLVSGLCGLLLDRHGLALPAAKCLWYFSSRRGRAEDRAPVRQLFEEKSLSALLSVAAAADTQAASSEEALTFLKCIACVLDGMGSQLCYEDAKEKSGKAVELPPAVGTYFNALLALLKHPALPLRLNAIRTVMSIVKTNSIVSHPTFRGLLVQFVEGISRLLVEKGWPSKSDDPSCTFSKLEYDDDEQFRIEFSKGRMQAIETTKLLVGLDHAVTYAVSKQWLVQALERQTETSDEEWDGMAKFLDTVVATYAKLPNFKQTSGAVRQDAIQLLHSAILPAFANQPARLRVLHALLSAMTTMACFLQDEDPASGACLVTVLEKVLEMTLYPKGEEFLDLRAHACNSLIRLAMDHPQVMVPYFDLVYSFLKASGAQLAEGQKRNIVDALMILCNHMNNGLEAKAGSFVGDILTPVVSQLKSEEFTLALASPVAFADYLGLAAAPAPLNAPNNIYTIRRRNLLTNYSLLLFAVRRIDRRENDHPALPYVQHLLECTLLLMRCMNGLYGREVLLKLHSDYGPTVLDISDVLKLTVMGVSGPGAASARVSTPASLCQTFIHSLSENLMMYIGHIFVRFPQSLLASSGIEQQLISGLCDHLADSTDYRMRQILRLILKPMAPYVAENPACKVMVPFLRLIIAHMYERLSARWEEFSKRQEREMSADGQGSESAEEMQEMYVEFLTRLLTREFMETLHAFLLVDKHSTTAVTPVLASTSSSQSSIENGHAYDSIAPANGAPGRDAEMNDDFPMMGRLVGAADGRRLSVLGKFLLEDEECITPLMLSIFHVYMWPDTFSVTRAVSMCACLLKALCESQRVNEQAVTHLFYCILCGLQTHGEHDNVTTPILMAALYAYELYRPTFSSLRSVLMQVPDIQESALDSFDQRILSQTADRKVPEKTLKEQFKKLVRGIIGQNVGQQFKRDAKVKPLEPFFKCAKKSLVTDVLASEDSNVLEHLFESA